MSQLLASPLAGSTPWRLTTAQLVDRTLPTSVTPDTAPVGVALHQVTELLASHVDLTTIELHRATTIATKQIKRAIAGPDRFETIRTIVTDPDRIATADGRTAADLCGRRWERVSAEAGERAVAALDGVERFGESTVLQLAILRTAQAQLPWWGTRDWFSRVETWSRSVRFAPRLKRTVRRSPELVSDDVLRNIVG